MYKTTRVALVTTALVGAVVGPATTTEAQDQPEARGTGLPSKVTWTFNFDASWGTFGFGNSLFEDPKEGVGGNLSDQWFEGSIKPALSADYTFAGSSVIYGKLSAVGERTYGAAPGGMLANPGVEPGRDGMDVFNLRAYTAPLPAVPDLSFEVEYATERNGDALHSTGWTAQGAYQLSQVAWAPKLSYRYAFFEGDDPATSRNEAFDPLLPGFSDWGAWWQGEIAGEYAVSNSNLISHQVRLHVTPGEAVSGGLMLYQFALDQPSTFAPGVTAAGLAFEADLYADWQINGNFTASVVLAFANPGLAAEQAFDRSQNFRYGMVFLAYSY